MSRPQPSTKDDAHALIERLDARGNDARGKDARGNAGAADDDAEHAHALEKKALVETLAAMRAREARRQRDAGAARRQSRWRFMFVLLMGLSALGIAVLTHLYFKASRREWSLLASSDPATPACHIATPPSLTACDSARHHDIAAFTAQ